jgi:hypothetical protein
VGSSWSGPKNDRRVFTEAEVEDLLHQAENRALPTPSIYDLEAFLKKLQKRHPVEVWWLRHYLKWLMKKCHKNFDVDMKNPYWMSRRAR